MALGFYRYIYIYFPKIWWEVGSLSDNIRANLSTLKRSYFQSGYDASKHSSLKWKKLLITMLKSKSAINYIFDLIGTVCILFAESSVKVILNSGQWGTFPILPWSCQNSSVRCPLSTSCTHAHVAPALDTRTEVFSKEMMLLYIRQDGIKERERESEEDRVWGTLFF